MTTRRFACIGVAIIAAMVSASAQPASTGRLPPWVCGAGMPPLFSDGFESGGDARYSEPSGGSGGTYPGAQTRSVQEPVNAAPGALHLDEHRDGAAAILHNDGLCGAQRARAQPAHNGALCNLAAGEGTRAKLARLS